MSQQTTGKSEHHKKLFKACNEGDVAQVKELLVLMESLDNCLDDVKCTPLHHCVAKNNVELTRLLLEHTVDVNKENSMKSTPLHYAAANNSVECVSILLSLPTVKKNERDEYGYAPIHLAVKKNYTETVKAMLKGEADINVRRRGCGSTALHFAIESGFKNMVNILVQEGASLTVRDESKRTPLLKAAQICTEQDRLQQSSSEAGDGRSFSSLVRSLRHIFSTLITRDDYVLSVRGEHNRNVFHVAAAHGNVEFLRLLASIIPSSKYEEHLLQCDGSAEGSTPLHLAIKYGHKECVSTLVFIDPKTVHTVDKNGNTPLHEACGMLSQQLSKSEEDVAVSVYSEMIEQLMRQGADLSIQNHFKISSKSLLKSNPELIERFSRFAIGGRTLYNIYPSEVQEKHINDLDVQAVKALGVDVKQKWSSLSDSSQYQAFSSVCRFAMYDARISAVLLDRGDDDSSTDETDTRSDTEEAKEKKTLGSHAYKVTSIVPYSIEQVLKTLANPENRSIFDNTLAASNQIDYYSTKNVTGIYPTSVTVDTYPLPWPMTTRDFVTSNSIVRTKHGDKDVYYVIKRSSKHLLARERRGTVRSLVLSAWIIEKELDSVTKYTYVEWQDLKLNDLSTGYFKKLNKKRFNSMHDNLMKALVKDEKNGFPDLLFSLGLMETLSELQKKIEVHGLRRASSADESQSRVKRIAYISRYSKSMSSQELKEIGVVSVRNNQKRSITGMLLCAGGLFYQVVEGLPEEVQEVYDVIFKDSRHTDIRLVLEEYGLKESDRQFPNWSMNTVNLDEHDDCFSEFMKSLIKMADELDLSKEKEELYMAETVGIASRVFVENDFSCSNNVITIAATNK